MIVGIDLGTTNSLIGAYLDNRPTLFPNAFGDFLTPSAVSIDDKGEVIVGRAARDRLLTHPDRSVATFKRWMGSPRETALGDRRLRPEELSALVLRSLLADAEAATGRRPTEAVISVPAYFSDAQRNATRAAGELAGVKVERLINEPTAAALAYGLHERDRDREARFLVFDLGGGTLDVSVVEIFEGVVEVHASAGDNFLGGEDFVDLLAKTAAGDLGFDPAELKPSDRAGFLRRLERLKIALSKAPEATAEFSIGGEERRWTIEEGRFASLAEPLVQRLRAPLERTLRDANLAPSDLDEVILVGGATRMPLVARLVARTLGRLPLRHVDPDHAIAQGAAVASGMKARNAKLDEIILTDVCPYTLGVDTTKFDSANAMHGGYFLPIINRSSSVPVSREEELWPVHDEQTFMMINVFQGEHPLAEKNVKLGSLKVPLPPGDDRSKRSVIVRFTYDINGILQVEVTVRATGERHELILEQNPGVLDKDEVRERLAALSELKLHPRENQENVALLARAERLYEEQLADRDRLQEMTLEFRAILESQDLRRISRARSEFAEALNMIERL